MCICISHKTAMEYLLRVPNPRVRGGRCGQSNVVPSGVPSDERARELLWALDSNLPAGTDRLDVLVRDQAGRHQTKTLRAHLCSLSLPAESFVSDSAFGVDFLVCAPELVFLQMVGEYEMDWAVYAGFALCSAFRLDSYEPGGCVHREGWDEPLTSVGRIRSYLERLPAGVPNRAAALRVLEYVRDGARSPREAGIAMIVGMPLGLGGRALGQTRMNPEIRIYDGLDYFGNKRWVTRIPDILVSAKDRKGELRRVGIDYDSDVIHSSPTRRDADVDRRNLIAASDNFAHITLKTSQVSNYVSFCRELDRIRRSLRQRSKPRFVGNRNSERNRRLAAQTQGRQFDLWNRVLGAETLAL